MRRRTVTTAALVLLVGAQAAWAAMTQSPSGIDDRLRLEWEASQPKPGRTVVAGYLYNDYKRAAQRVVLLVEALDASGQVVGRAIAPQPGTVPPFGRSYFEVPVKATGTSYRIAVTSFEWNAGSN